MKKFIGICAFLMIALVALVSAAPTMTVTGINLGSSSQERSNPLSDRETDFNLYVDGIITLTNPANGEAITGITVSQLQSESGYTTNDLNATIELKDTTLAPGNSTTAKVKVRVPKYLDAIDSSFVKTGMNVGTFTFTAKNESGGTQQVTSTVNVQAENMLKIDDVDIKITGIKSRTESGKDGETIKDIKPKDIIELVIIVKNKFMNRDDLEIEGILVRVASENSEFDVDEEEDISSVSPNEKEEVTIRFEVEDDQKGGSYDVAIEVDGVDENGAHHGERWVMTFKVERKSHEIVIKSSAIMPESIYPGESAELKVTMWNIGTNDEDKAALSVGTPLLKFGEILSGLTIDENDELTKRFTVNVPEDTAPGKYRIDIKTFYSDNTESDAESALIEVLAPKATQQPAAPDACAGVFCQDTTKICADNFAATCVNTCTNGTCSQCTPSCAGHDVVPPITGQVPAKPVTPPAEEKAKVSPLYIGGLVALNVLVLLIGVFIIVKLAKK